MTATAHAVITGAAGDIGSAMVRRMLADGYGVTALDVRSDEDWAHRHADLAADPRVQYATADVADRSRVRAVLAATERVDVVLGNAGVGTTRSFLDIDDAYWDASLRTNLTGNFVVGQEAARHMVAAGRAGRIIFTGSWVGQVPWPDITAYTVAKAGLTMLAKQMAKELAPHRILVNVVAPGIVAAGLAGELLRTDPAYARRAARVVPLRAFQTPEQVAGVAAFLASPAADYITGTVLTADGGCSLFDLADEPAAD
jgi:NAD(P)-dependent dehydrogenase (short-subunit alcohol dehydrogenase family)